MDVNDHWQVQGRQGHGWFGHGTGPGKAENSGHDPSTAFRSVDDRVVALVHGAIASLPASLRVRAEAHHQRGTLPRLKEALTAWIRGARLDRTAFADHFLGRAADDPIADTLRSAAFAAATATSHADMADAAGRLANAIKAVGIDRWPGFVADASERARNPATQAATQASSQPPPHAPDAIRPVYPVETAIGIAAAGLLGGAGAAARALGGAIVRGVAPARRLAAEDAPAEETVPRTRPTGSPALAPKQDEPNAAVTEEKIDDLPFSRQRQNGHIAGTPQNKLRLKQNTTTSTFDGSPAEADALTQEAWRKGTPRPARPDIRDHDFGRRIGTAPNGDGQSTVSVHQDEAGRIHGHPSGQEFP